MESLASHTTFKIGGPARCFVAVRTDEEVKTAVALADAQRLPLLVLGGGSNVLIDDEGFLGVVLHMKSDRILWNDNEAIVDAGVSWDAFVGECVARGYYGLENLSSIPGTVGGAMVQNIGAYGVEVASCVAWIEVFDPRMQAVRRISKEEARFGYRDSIFKHEEGRGLIILRAAFLLHNDGALSHVYKDIIAYEKAKPIVSLADMREAIIAIRAQKFPDLARYGTAGSFFKNPIVTVLVAERFLKRYPDAPCYMLTGGMYKLSAAWIIDHALNLRGFRDGDVGTWEAQALVLVNYGSATARDVHAFVRMIQSRAHPELAITLEPEVVFVN